MVRKWDNLRADELGPIAILDNCLGEHNLLLSNHLDVTFVIAVDYLKFLTKDSTNSLRKNGEYLVFALLNVPFPGSKHTSIWVLLRYNFCCPTNFIGVIPIIINMEVFHVASPWVDRYLPRDIISLQIKNQHEVVF